MAETTLIYRRTAAVIDTVTLDASVTESHQSSVEVTQHPIETGANIIDHARAKPDMLTIEGVVSNTPVSRAQTRRIVDASGTLLQTTATTDAPADQPGNAGEAYQKLLALKDTGKLITVVTSLRTYTNMVMTSLTLPRDARVGDALRFTATFQQVRVVTNKTTTVVVAREPKAKRKVKTGKQVAKTAPQSTKEKYSSIANDWFGGIFQKQGLTN